jgi:cell division protein FtsB
MKSRRSDPTISRETLVQGLALAVLLVMGIYVVAGPSGVFAWGENQRLLEERRDHLAQLQVARDRLKNRVSLLDPARADPDLTGELLRSNLNVARPDEMVMLLPR